MFMRMGILMGVLMEILMGFFDGNSYRNCGGNFYGIFNENVDGKYDGN